MKNNLTDLLEFYQINDLLTEAYHIYQPSKFSLYRKNISYIAEDIDSRIMDEPFYSVYTDNKKDAQIYEYSDIFGDFSFIDKLKIYLEVDESDHYHQCNGIAIIDEETIKNDFIKSEFPLYKFQNNHYEICSIILNIHIRDVEEGQVQYEIENALSHELKHIMDALWNRNNIKKSIQQNSIINELLDEYNVNIDTLETDDEWTLEDFVFFITQMLYYCQPTEMSAHIETIIGEIKDRWYRNEFDLKYIDNKDRIENYLINNSKTFRVYKFYQRILLGFVNGTRPNIKNKRFSLFYSNKEIQDEIPYFIKKLNQYTKHNFNLHHYMRYWNNQVNKQIVNVIKLFPKYLKDNNL